MKYVNLLLTALSLTACVAGEETMPTTTLPTLVQQVNQTNNESENQQTQQSQEQNQTQTQNQTKNNEPEPQQQNEPEPQTRQVVSITQEELSRLLSTKLYDTTSTEPINGTFSLNENTELQNAFEGTVKYTDLVQLEDGKYQATHITAPNKKIVLDGNRDNLSYADFGYMLQIEHVQSSGLEYDRPKMLGYFGGNAQHEVAYSLDKIINDQPNASTTFSGRAIGAVSNGYEALELDGIASLTVAKTKVGTASEHVQSQMKFDFDNFYDIEIKHHDIDNDPNYVNNATFTKADETGLISYNYASYALPRMVLTNNDNAAIPENFATDRVKNYLEGVASSVVLNHYADTPDSEISELSGVLSTTHSNRANTNPKLMVTFGMKRQ